MVVGAVAGANLGLIVMDIRADRRAANRVAEMSSGERLEASPSVG